MVVPVQVAAKPSNFGKFDSFLYKDWRYPRDARNRFENDHRRKPDRKGMQIQKQRTIERKALATQEIQVPLSQSQSSPSKRERLVEPAYLFFLNGSGDCEWWKVAEWRKENRNRDVSYVFVSFFSHHFPSQRDYPILERIGLAAAKKAGTTAFWISTACVSDLDEHDKEKKRAQTEQTVWSMSDIIRGARALAVAVRTASPNENVNQNLLEWGERMWTMPELLLMTGDEKVLIYENDET